MARIKGGLNAKRKHNRVLKMAKGYRGARSKQYRVAKQSVMRALATAYRGRELSRMMQSTHILEDFAEKLSDVAVVDRQPKAEGRSLVLILGPKKS